jgi:hypothetical protein
LVARKHGKNTIILQDDLKAWLKALPMIEKIRQTKKPRKSGG